MAKKPFRAPCGPSWGLLLKNSFLRYWNPCQFFWREMWVSRGPQAQKWLSPRKKKLEIFFCSKTLFLALGTHKMCFWTEKNLKFFFEKFSENFRTTPPLPCQRGQNWLATDSEPSQTVGHPAKPREKVFKRKQSPRVAGFMAKIPFWGPCGPSWGFPRGRRPENG